MRPIRWRKSFQAVDPKHPIQHPVHQYARDVLDGKYPSCKKLRQACQRHLDFLDRDDLFFDAAEADRAIAFAQQFQHVKGQWDSDYIILVPWQQFIMGSLFGWKVVETGLRLFRSAYVQIPRKNAKSTLASIIGLYGLIADGEPGAEVYSAATKRDQAKIIFDTAKAQVRKQPTLKKILGIYTNNIHHLASNSKFEPLSADAHSMDGLNIHVALVDELHAHKSGAVLEVITTATGSRRQPIVFMITTAGFERAVCIETYNYCEQILDGIHTDDTLLIFITEMEEGDDWTDPAVWAKANPNLGVSVFISQLESECRKAVAIPARQNNFLCKHLNKWVNQADRWIDMDQWKACGGKIVESDLYGRECYAGLDLSATRDITAFVLVFPPEHADDKWQVIGRYWVPKEQVDRRAKGYLVDKVPYDAWEREGLIQVTPGNVIDYDFVRDEILKLAKLFDVKEIAYDPYKATETAIKLTNEGLEMVAFRQGARSYDAPMTKLEELLVDGQLCHGSHPALTWMANNMTVRYDPNLNKAPDKKNAKDRIDGVVAMLMGMGRAMVQEGDQYIDGEVWFIE